MSQETCTRIDSLSIAEHGRIVVITVTYGDRQRFLEDMVTCCIANGVKRFIFVNNGANWDVDSLPKKYSDCHIDLIQMRGNKGSAVAYSAGIRMAMECDEGDLFWLLDDDLAPEDDCLDNLLKAYENLSLSMRSDQLAVLAARPEFLETLSTDSYATLMNPSENTFLEFSITGVWLKLKKRLPFFARRAVTRRLPNQFSVKMAPYGGLLFHRSVVDCIGYPDTRFMLYVDDYEYTNRLALVGGKIMLIPSARLKELEQCWNSGRSHFSSFHAWLSGSDFRAYYTARNMSYFETHVRNNRGLLYRLNKFTYLTILRLIALLQRRGARMRLLRDAIRAGVAGRLGLDNRFPLP